ncbi:MAG: beta-N-acetylglucosaminidase domain-containing protein [Deltaproteobacteria bacterium]|nr:beta-N-acetylglucosaminidase domain-containing protein [Deltaproteobacteria bacterium]
MRKSLCASLLIMSAVAACGPRAVGTGEFDAATADAGGADAGQECDAEVVSGEERDLVPYARLYASDTQPRGGLPWPREAEDAIATVRDDDPATGWKAPVGKKSTVSIDLQPWLGRAVALSTLSGAFSGAPPKEVNVDLVDGCAGKPSRQLEWKAFPDNVDLGGARAGCVEISFGTTEAMTLTDLTVTTREAFTFPRAGSVPPARAGLVSLVPPLQPATYSLQPRSGVVEGFYGAPWSWRERAHMIETMAALGLGAYVYGPKLDLKHRERWREAYSEDEVAAFAELAGLAERTGVSFFFGISPFIDYDASADVDFRTLKSKLHTMLGAGIDAFVVMADDIEFATSFEVGAELAAIHVDTVNRLFAELKASQPDLKMWFVGTVYSDDRATAWEGGRAYLEGLAGLDPAIGVMWTGPGTSSATMTASDMEAVTAATGRKPVIWENYWANDAGDGFQGKLLLGPFLGRGPDLPLAVEGICQNPMIQGSLSRLNLGAFGAWLGDPTLSDPDAARASASDLEDTLHALPEIAPPAPDCPAGDGLLPQTYSLQPPASSLLPVVMAIFSGGAMGEARYPDMESAIDSLVAAVKNGSAIPLSEAAAAMRVFAQMATLRSEVRHSRLDADLVDELEFPLEKVMYDGQAGLFALASLGERLAGRDGAEYGPDFQRASLKSAENRFVYSAGAVDSFYREVGRVEPADVGFVAPAIFEPDRCTTGKALAWETAEAGAEVEVLGLPGAEVDGTKVTWTPPHSGTWDAAVIATTGNGWSFRLVTLVCER